MSFSGCIAGLLVLVVTVHASEHTVFRKGQEYVYQYLAYSTTGALEPSSHVSAFALKGALRVQGFGDYALAKLDSLAISTYNGAFDYANYPVSEFVQKDDLLSPLEIPFKVNYETNGQADSIDVNTNEAAWVVNIKKATASILQLHVENLKNGEKIFTVPELSVQGSCPVSYEVTPCPIYPDTTNIVRKYRHNAACVNSPMRLRNTMEGHFCEVEGANVNDPVHSGSFQTYIVEGVKDRRNIQRVDIMSQVLFRPFSNAGLTQYSFVNYTLILDTVKDTGKYFQVPQPTTTTDDLTYVFDVPVRDAKAQRDLKEPENLFFHEIDFSLSQDDALERLLKLFEQLVDSTEDRNVHDHVEKAHNTAYYLAIPLASKLNYDHLKSLHDILSQGKEARDLNMMKLYVDLLPLIGTSPAALLVLELAQSEGTLEGVVQIPFHIHSPTELLLQEYEVLLTTFASDSIKHQTATLAFASLLQETCKYFCHPETEEKHINNFFKKFEGSTTESDKLHYILALRNIGSGKVGELLIPVVRGETGHSDNVRYHAMWASRSLLKTNKYKILEVFLPIFYNRQLSHELRIGAFGLVFSTNPTFDVMQRMAVSLFTENNLQVVHFVYTAYKSVSLSANPCYQEMAKHATFLLKYMGYVRTLQFNLRYSGFYLLDYSDPNFGFGHATKLAIISSTDSVVPRTMYFGAGAQFAKYSSNYMSIYVRQEGLSHAAYEQIVKFNPEDMKQDDLRKIFEQLRITTRGIHNAKLEIVFFRSSRAIIHLYFDENSFSKVTDYSHVLQVLQQEFYVNRVRGLISVDGLYEEPSDLGIPVCILVGGSGIFAVKGDFKRSVSGTSIYRDSDMHIHYSQHILTAVINYNPITGLMHSVSRSRLFTANVPLELKVGIDFAQQQLKFAVGVTPEEDPLEYVFHAFTKTSIRSFGKNNPDEILHESCPTCHRFSQVSAGKQNRKNLDLLHVERSHLGSHLHAEVFDCERAGGKADVLELIKHSFSSQFQSSKDPINVFLLGYSSIIDYLMYAPRGDTCGLYVLFSQSHQNPASKIEGVIRLKRDEIEPSSPIWKSNKYLIRTVITVKGVDEKSEDRKVEVNLVYTHGKLFETTELKMKVVRSAIQSLNVKEAVVCVELSRKLPPIPEDFLSLSGPESNFKSHTELSVVWGESSNSKCPLNKAGIKVTSEGSRTPEQIALQDKDIWPYNQCRKDKANKEDWPGDFTPITDACMAVAYAQTSMYKTDVKIKFARIPENIRRLCSTTVTALKGFLYPYWEVDIAVDKEDSDDHQQHEAPQADAAHSGPRRGHSHGHKEGGHKHDVSDEDKSSHEDGSHEHKDHKHDGKHSIHRKVPEGELQFIRIVHATEPQVDFHIHSHTEMNHFENIDYSFLGITPPTPNIRFLKSLELAYISGLLGMCVVTPHLVQTMDNVTYHHDLSDCYTLVSSDCSDNPKFALFVKDSGSSTLVIKFYVGGHYLEIDNAESPTIKVNGEVVSDIKEKGYTFPPEERYLYFQVAKNDRSFTVYSPIVNVYFEYTHGRILLTLPSLYRSHHCGLCGNFDGEAFGEFESPEHCQLASGALLSNSFALNDGICQAPTHPTCHHTQHKRDTSTDYLLHRMMKNIVQ